MCVLQAAVFCVSQDVETDLTNAITTTLVQSPCTRLLTADGSIGCGTGPKGITGLLYNVESQTDFNNFVALNSDQKYALVLPPSFMSLSTLTQVGALSWFAGVVALPDPLGDDFSPAPKNLPYGSQQEFAWNPAGRELLFTRFDFPIVAVIGDVAVDMRSRARSNAGNGVGHYPQWAINFLFYMGPDSLNSIACLDSGSCLPLGGQSVWGALGGLDSSLSTGRRALLEGASGGGDADGEQRSAGPATTRKMSVAHDRSKNRRRLIVEASMEQDTSTDFAAEQLSRQLQPTPPSSGARRPQRPVVMAVCPMDAAALFHDLAFGADAAAASIATMLAAAEALSHTDAAALPYQILFGVFQAEAWGRMGSRRWVGEVRSFTCQQNVSQDVSPTGRDYCAFPLRTDVSFSKLQLSDVQYVLAVDQVGGRGSTAGSGLYVHTDAPSPSAGSTWISSVLQALSPTSPVPVQQAVTRPAPPPTPVLSFQELFPSIGAAVLSEYNGAFSNPFFYSRFDNSSNVDSVAVTAAATVLARGLYAVASNKTTPAQAAGAVPAELQANAQLVSDILGCITVNAQCTQFAMALGVSIETLQGMIPAGPLSLYTSVYNQPYTLPSNGYVLQPTPLEAFVRNSLAYYTASAVAPGPACTSTSECQQRSGLSRQYECLFAQCVIGQAYYHDALSPALSATRTVGQYLVDQDLTTLADPLWTEPYWSSKIGATVFLRDSAAAEGGTLAAGVTITLLAGLGCRYLVAYLDKHYKVP